MQYVSPIAAPPSAAPAPPAEPAQPAAPAAVAPAAPAAPPGRVVLARGLLAGAVGWLALGIVAAYLSSVERANRSVYRALRTRMESLDIESKGTGPEPSTITTPPQVARTPTVPAAETTREGDVRDTKPSREGDVRDAETARAGEEVRRHLDDLRKELGDSPS
jgi:hypothetical protein